MDQLVLFRVHGLDCLSLDGSYALLHPSSDSLSARPHGKRLILEKLHPSTGCSRIKMARVCASSDWCVQPRHSLSLRGSQEQMDGSGLPLDVFSEFSRLSQLGLSTPCFCEHSPVCSISQRRCGMPRHTCCCRPISSPPEGPHLFRPGHRSSWDIFFLFHICVFLVN